MILLHWMFCEVKSPPDKNGIKETNNNNKKLLQAKIKIVWGRVIALKVD